MKNLNFKHYNNQAGFTLVEIIIAVAIVAILAILAFQSFSSDWAKDTVRSKSLEDVTLYLQEFKQQYWVYPNSWTHGRKYPASWCSVNWYGALIDCFVSLWKFDKDTETYNNLRYDPKEGEQNDNSKTFQFLYCASSNGNKYKLNALAWKQDNPDYKWLDGKDAEIGSRFMFKISPNTKVDELSTCNP